MGKKSRLKKNRRALKAAGFTDELMKKLVSIDGYNKPIYRFFPEKWQAESLCNGNVWISTLETCRQYEDPLQGDSEEATHTYNSGHVVGGSDDPAFMAVASRSGIDLRGNCSDIIIKDCTNIQKLRDAYVLCTTREFKPQNLSDTFGNYCVKISNPSEFFKLVSATLNKQSPIREGGMGLVQYKDRNYTGLQSTPGPIGFVKPEDQYSSQKEFRMLWVPQTSDVINPFLLECPDVSKLCSLMS
ncbi:hypothetical protein [Vibrio lentus]|uniref:hypothetical protein n=1 Tax=Vibrio lentus TaxID=136468 RepID=UPI000C81DD48|nr:hypothetical protein [Vibrio lentus]PML05226.1 hypothetical protein BCT85_24025 [Vibrio lentus]